MEEYKENYEVPGSGGIVFEEASEEAEQTAGEFSDYAEEMPETATESVRNAVEETPVSDVDAAGETDQNAAAPAAATAAPPVTYMDYYADGTPVTKANAPKTQYQTAQLYQTGTSPYQTGGTPYQAAGTPYQAAGTPDQTGPAPSQNAGPRYQDQEPQYQSTAPQYRKNEQQYEPYRFSEEWSRRQVDPQPMRREKKSDGGSFIKKLLLTAAIAAVFGVIAGLCFLGVTALGRAGIREDITGQRSGAQAGSSAEAQVPETESSKITAGTSETVPKATITPSGETGAIGSVADVAESSMPALVAITNLSTQQYYSFFGQSGTYENESAGSGIIVGETDTELLIATNDHVIADADTLTICFVDGEAVPGVVKGSDHVNDLAIVAVTLEDIPEETLSQIRIIPIGDSDALRIGDQVVAIGNALGFGQSVSGGYVSALNRTVMVDGEEHVLLQTDAAINPGNSGGALLNMKGELIGINEVKYVAEDTEGIGYAIPISFAKPILDELMNKETRRRVAEEDSGYMGIKCITVTEQYSQALNIPVGAYVDSVEPGGAAEKAGIRARDIITAVDGYAVTSTTELVGELRYYAAGETIPVTVARLGGNNEYEEIEITITLGKRPVESQSGD